MHEASSEHTDSASNKKDYGSLLGKDVLYYLPVKLFPAITGLLSIFILTRKLAPSEYGTYSVVITTTLLFTQLAGTWLSNSVLYVYPDYVKNHDIAFQINVLKIQAIAAIPAALIAYAALLFLTHNQSLALIGSLMLVLQMFQFLMQTFLQSTRQVTSQAISVGVQTLTQLTVLCVFVFLANGKEAAALIAIAAGYAAAIVVLLIQGKSLRGKNNLGSELDTKELFKKLFSYGMPMCIWFFATQFYTVGDRLLLKMFNVTVTLGQYASFRDLCTGCAGFLTMPLLMASHPIIISMWKEGAERTSVERLISRNISLLALMFVPLLVLIDLCGSELIGALLGSKYLLDTRIMLLVVGSIFINCVAIYAQKGLEVTGNTLLMSKAAIATVIFSFAGNYFAIMRFGVAGAAVMVLLSQLGYLGLIRYCTRKILTAKLPASLCMKLLIWVVTVEILCRFFLQNFDISYMHVNLMYVKVAITVFATSILYLMCEETSVLIKHVIAYAKR